jgi:5-methyltetrahydropteroyltriglutamate--homocysteine methyltransferase
VEVPGGGHVNYPPRPTGLQRCQHVCWGNWEGPHVQDVAMEIILPALYQANVSALGLEFANPRRQHEVAALRKCKLPDRMVLIPV